MITARNLSLSYDNIEVLEDINLDIESGAICAIIGPSGCGKSSLLNIFAGLNKSYAGEVTIEGKKINPKKQTIGYIPQNYGLLPWLKVKENIMVGLKIKSGSKAQLPMELITRVGLEQLLDRYPQELSGGQRQRVSLLRAFSINADLLLMDEPFSALDTITREEMQEVFLDLWSQNKPTTLLVTHFVEEAIYLGEYIIVMSANPGRIHKIIKNSLFGVEDFRSHSSYLALSKELRRDLQRVVGKDEV